MLVTLWVFIGIEGAVVLSSRAKDKKDVGKATIIGLLGTLLIYILITIMSLGVMSRPDIAKLDSPSMAFVFEQVVGKWSRIYQSWFDCFCTWCMARLDIARFRDSLPCSKTWSIPQMVCKRK